MKRAADIVAALDNPPQEVVDAIYRLDAKAHGNGFEISEADLAGRIRRRARDAGSESELARQLGLRRQELHDYTSGRRGASPRLLRALRLKRFRKGDVFVPEDDI